MDKKIIVIDLDGTFVNVNTFHKWMKFVFIESIKSFHMISVLKILTIVCLRYLKRINHSKMKFLILQISERNISQKQILVFVNSLDIHVHQHLLDLIKNQDNITILATAAPLLYSIIIKERYDFDYVIATGDTNTANWNENIRERKKRNLVTLLTYHSLPKGIDVLYTDHYDDLPLMQYAQLTYLVNPSEKTKQITYTANISVRIID